jgi:carotenoid cleavage dioxygenase
MRYGVVDGTGALVHLVPIALPGARLPHDMAVTERYTILHDLPLFHDAEALKVGRHKLAFHPHVPARFGVIPRHGAAGTIRWFEAEPCFVYHVVNAWEEGDEVVMVGCRYVTPTSGGAVDARRMARMIAELQMDARLYRWRFDLRTGRTREATIDPENNVEFPTAHAGLTGRRTRWAYLMAQTREVPHFTGITRHDTDTGAFERFSDGPGAFYSEAPFAPRDGATGEDDGYLVSFVWNANTARSEVQVFDARRVHNGPLARVRLPQRVPVGFHATWMPASKLAR